MYKMSKYLLLLTFTFLVSCNNHSELELSEPQSPKNVIIKEFHASTGASPNVSVTRLAMSNDGPSVVWSRSDTVAIFAGTSSRLKYIVKDGHAGNYNTILTPFDIDNIRQTGNGEYYSALESFYYNSDIISELSTNVAYYPYSNVRSCSEIDGTFRLDVVIPNKQPLNLNSFSDNYLPIIAVTQNLQDDELYFKNVMGLVKLSLDGDVVLNSISIYGNNKEKIAGNATIICSANSNPIIQYSSTASDTIKVTMPEGLQLSKDVYKDLFVVMPPAVYTQGISIDYKIGNCTITKRLDDPFELHRSEIIPFEQSLVLDSIIASLNKPAISWIDDDFIGVANDGTISEEYQVVHDYCLENNIALDFAYIPTSASAKIYIPEPKVAVARQWQSEGFGFLMHPYHNQGWFNVDANNPHDATKIEASIIECYEDFEIYRLNTPKILVWPGNSNIFEDNLEIVKDYYDCAIRSSYNEVNHGSNNDRYQLARLSFQALSKGILTKTQFKQRIKDAVENGDWIIFASHIYEIEVSDVPDETSYNTANVFELLEYANSLCTMRHTEDIWNERKPMWELNNK